MTPAPAEAEKNTKNVTDSNSLKRLRYIFAALLSALFLAAPYHFPGAWPLAFIAFLPALFMLRGHTSSFAFKLFFLMGFFYYLLTGYWLCYVNIFGFVLLALYLALYFGIFGSLSCSFLASGQLRASLTVAALWTLLEYTRGYLLSGFPWALLGYSQWKNLPIIQIADVVGAFGVSFFVMWVNVMLFSAGGGPASGGKIYRSRNILVLTVVFLSVWTYGFFTLRSREAFYTDGLSKAKLSVAVLQGNIPQEEKWDARIKTIIFEKYKRLTLMAAMEKPDLIVWPETSFPGYLEDEVVMAAHLRSTARAAHTHLLVGAPTVGDLETVQTMKFYNSAVFFTPKGEEVSRYHKMHLVPFGEYVPFEHLIGFIRNFVTIGRFSPGDKQTLFSIATEHQPIRIAAKFGVLICYEDIFPGKVREMCKNGADFLVNISNDAWFGKTSAPYQHAQASVFRAVENRVPVVRSTNTGLSCFITSEGRITASVKKDGEELMVSGRQAADVILRRGRPFFTRYGDLFFWLILGWLIFAYRDKHKKSGYSRA